MQDSFKNCFHKKNRAFAGLSENGRTKWFLIARKSVFTRWDKVIFHKLDFQVSTSRKNPLNERTLFQLNRESVSTHVNAEFVYEGVSARGKTARNIWKIKENGCHGRVLNRFLHNLNNGFHYHERKLWIKTIPSFLGCKKHFH